MRAFGARFRTKTAIADSSHVHWQQKHECTECLRGYLLVQFHFLGQTLKNANC
jgi:hypothetical protein